MKTKKVNQIRTVEECHKQLLALYDAGDKTSKHLRNIMVRCVILNKKDA